MAIQTLSDLKALINSTIYDNTTNEISGSDVQTALINAIDTLDSAEGFVNVHKANGQTTITAYGSKALARAAVPSDFHYQGIVIAYKLSTGWVIEQNLDATAGTWSDDASWVTTGPVSVSQNTITIGDDSYTIAEDKATLIHDETTNFINNNNWIENAYIDNGQEIYFNGFYATGKVPLSANVSYYYGGGVYVRYCAFYDENDNVIASYDTLENQLPNPFVPPTGTLYGRFTALSEGEKATAWIGLSNNAPAPYQEKLKDSGIVVNENIRNDTISFQKISFKESDKCSNLIPQDWINDAYINDSGVVVTGASGLNASGKVLLEPNSWYYHNGLAPGYYAFYANDGSLIQGYGYPSPIPNPFKTPANTAYARFTAFSTVGTWVGKSYDVPIQHKNVIKKSVLPTDIQYAKTFCNYYGNEISVFKRGICCGDSMTAGTFNSTTDNFGISGKSYPDYLAKMTGIVLDKKGIGGDTSDQWWDDVTNSESSYYINDWTGYDFAILCFGINDALQRGAWTNDSKSGYLNIINKLKTENSKIKIFVTTFLPCTDFNITQLVKDEISQGIRDMVFELNDPNIVIVDLALYGHTADSPAYNYGHFTALGYWRLAQDISSYISYYIKTHLTDFRDIQCIGTNYEIQ